VFRVALGGDEKGNRGAVVTDRDDDGASLIDECHGENYTDRGPLRVALGVTIHRSQLPSVHPAATATADIAPVNAMTIGKMVPGPSASALIRNAMTRPQKTPAHTATAW